jgi:hypothetical protein
LRTSEPNERVRANRLVQRMHGRSLVNGTAGISNDSVLTFIVVSHCCCSKRGARFQRRQGGGKCWGLDDLQGPLDSPRTLGPPIDPTGPPTVTTAGWSCCGGNGDRRDTAGIGRGQRGRDDLVDHVVGDREQCRRHGEAEGLGGLEVEDQLVLGRCLYWKIGGLLAL